MRGSRLTTSEQKSQSPRSTREINPKHLRFLTTLLALLMVPVALFGQRCGGTERWSVKVGTDAGAMNVDLDHPQQLSVAQALAVAAWKSASRLALVAQGVNQTEAEGRQ